MKILLTALGVAGWFTTAQVQPTSAFPLWPEGAPGALGRKPKDVPALTPFFPSPEAATGAALVVCPGGGYEHLAPHEGKAYARWLNDHGVAAFVLKYRLGSDGYRHPAMLQDASRALRLVRANAVKWKLDPHRIGIIGSSAGGHVAATLLTHSDAGNPAAADPIERVSSRPDLGILCYPVITMGEFAHAGSRKHLLGTNPPADLARKLSSELHVTKGTPPCFIWGTAEDATVPIENSLQFAGALRRAGVPFELHVYQKGPHGQGLGVRQYPPSDSAKLLPWTRDCSDWLRLQGFVK